MGMGGMGMGMSSMPGMSHSLGSMYATGLAPEKQLAAAAPAVNLRQQYDAARAAAAAAAAGGGADMMDDDQGNGYSASAPVQRQSGVRGGNVFNRLTAGVVGGGGAAESEEARRLRAQGRFAY